MDGIWLPSLESTGNRRKKLISTQFFFPFQNKQFCSFLVFWFFFSVVYSIWKCCAQLNLSSGRETKSANYGCSGNQSNTLIGAYGTCLAWIMNLKLFPVFCLTWCAWQRWKKLDKDITPLVRPNYLDCYSSVHRVILEML